MIKVSDYKMRRNGKVSIEVFSKGKWTELNPPSYILLAQHVTATVRREVKDAHGK